MKKSLNKTLAHVPLVWKYLLALILMVLSNPDKIAISDLIDRCFAKR